MRQAAVNIPNRETESIATLHPIFSKKALEHLIDKDKLNLMRQATASETSTVATWQFHIKFEASNFHPSENKSKKKSVKAMDSQKRNLA